MYRNQRGARVIKFDKKKLEEALKSTQNTLNKTRKE